MKAFDEWWNKESWKLTDEVKRYDCKQTWKAALEWVLSLGDNEEPYTWENIINHKIREELDE